MQGFDLLIKILEGATVIIGVLVGGYKFFRNVENKIDGIGEDIKEIKSSAPTIRSERCNIIDERAAPHYYLLLLSDKTR